MAKITTLTFEVQIPTDFIDRNAIVLVASALGWAVTIKSKNKDGDIVEAPNPQSANDFLSQWFQNYFLTTFKLAYIQDAEKTTAIQKKAEIKAILDANVILPSPAVIADPV